MGVEEEEQEEQEEDEDEDEDLFAPDAPDVPRSTQPRPPLSRETTVPSEQSVPHPDTAKDDDPMSALTPLPSSLNATQAGGRSSITERTLARVTASVAVDMNIEELA